MTSKLWVIFLKIIFRLNYLVSHPTMTNQAAVVAVYEAIAPKVPIELELRELIGGSLFEALTGGSVVVELSGLVTVSVVGVVVPGMVAVGAVVSSSLATSFENEAVGATVMKKASGVDSGDVPDDQE